MNVGLPGLVGGLVCCWGSDSDGGIRVQRRRGFIIVAVLLGTNSIADSCATSASGRLVVRVLFIAAFFVTAGGLVVVVFLQAHAPVAELRADRASV